MLTGTSAAQLEALTCARRGSCSQRAQRARGHRQHDVVDRAAEGVLDDLEVVEVRVHPAVAPVRADRRVERHVGRRVQQLPGDLADALRGLRRVRGRLARMLRGPQQRAGRPAAAPWRRPRPRARAAAASLGSGCGSHGRTGGVSPTGTGFASNRTVARSTPEIAVDERVVRLADQREAVALEALHEPHLPQRLGAVELLGEDAARSAARAGRRRPAPAARSGARGTRGSAAGRRPRPARPTAAAGRRASAGSAARGAGAPRRARRTRRSWAAGPRRRSTAPMCMCARSFSWVRKLASVALSRSRCETAIGGTSLSVARSAGPAPKLTAACELSAAALRAARRLRRRRSATRPRSRRPRHAADHRVERARARRRRPCWRRSASCGSSARPSAPTAPPRRRRARPAASSARSRSAAIRQRQRA